MLAFLPFVTRPPREYGVFTTTGDYQYGDRSFCGGEVTEQLVMVVRFYEGHVVIIENVPAGVCRQCGERYYRGAVEEEMERLMETSPARTIRRMSVPVMALTAHISPHPHI